MKRAEVISLINQVLPPIRQKLENPTMSRMADGFIDWRRKQERVTLDADERSNLCVWLRHTLVDKIDEIQDWRRRHESFQQRLAGIADAEERQRAILDFIRLLGSRGKAFRADRAALRRWFGSEAIADRVHTRTANTERDLALGLKLLGLHSHVLLESKLTTGQMEAWRKLDLETLALPLFTYDGAPQVRLAAFRMLRHGLDALPVGSRETAMDARTTQFVYRTAQEPRQDPWLQAETLELLSEVSPTSASKIITERLVSPLPDSDLFVRRRALKLACALLPQQNQLGLTISATAGDPSDYVRQTLAEELGRLPHVIAESLLPLLACKDPAAPVRARAALAIADRLDDPDHSLLINTLEQLLRQDKNAFVLRTGMLAARKIIDQLADRPEAATIWLTALTPPLRQLHVAADELKVRRWAAMCLEYLRAQADPTMRAQLNVLRAALGNEDTRTRIPRELAAIPALQLGRLASVIAQNDFGLHFARQRRGGYVRRGHHFGRRLWRFLYEWRHPSPDKRQAHRHTIGRIFAGKLHAPSAILAELSETKVPGEPLHFASEDGWRPYLPLVDQLLSLLDDPGDASPLCIVSAEGVTTVRPPPSLHLRIAASAKLTWRFAEYSQLRNWHEEEQQPPERFIKELRALNFEIQFTPWEGNGSDPAVNRFFAGGVMSLPIDDLWRRFENYFFSAYENTLGQLAVFIGAALSIFIGRHLIANRAQRIARTAIPLVIGGWGTRGKSGTERLKAALFNSLGYSVLSKTTGCEAMFLFGSPYQPLREMFLFRPYDKATIWEQHNVTCMAASLKVDVMLWECMALTPTFVALLQKRWMRDDLSTITNTFPDHEDIQGPAGIDIPRVMTHFIPKGGQLFSSEEQMRPILADAAKKIGTPMKNVGWLESGLITADVRARFPYEEHPDNIALVVRLAKELAIDEDYALKEMADRVVPDIGVLKVFPAADVEGREISFANGMSANERFGCLNNWQRLGFDRHDPDLTPGEIISTVVNNRADRIARSRVFAGILVEDIAADYHFLIGSNLEGLLGYIRESWQSQLASISLWNETGIAPADLLEMHARRLRISFSETRVKGRLAAMLGQRNTPALLSLWNEPDSLKTRLTEAQDEFADTIANVVKEELVIYRDYQGLQERLRHVGTDATSRVAFDAEFRNALWRWFERKLIVVTDFHATGNQIIQLIAHNTPPRLHHRVMGIQNIKGTGLDFVYRWLAWETCHRAGQQLLSGDQDTFRRGLNALNQFSEFGVLTDVYLQRLVEKIRACSLAQSERVQSELTTIDNRRQMAMAQFAPSGQATTHHSYLHPIASAIEGFFDAGDAIQRRRQANRIYADLITQRISQARAAEELLRLTQRQKGGWLAGEAERQMQRQIELWQLIRTRCTKLIPQLTRLRPSSPQPDKK